jgi:voltage-gated potassium channel Kch
MDQRLLFALALAQGGEFAFVLFSFSVQNGVLGAAVSGRLVAAVALTMAATPVIISVFQRFLQPRVGTKERVDRPYDAMNEDAPVIIAGHGRFGQIVARLLESQSIPMTVLEYDSDQIELLRKFGRQSFYGDASRYDLLEAAGAAKARLLVLAIDRPEKTLEIVHTVKRHFPQLKIVARSRGRTDAYDLIEAGVDHVIRETFGSAVEAGTRALEQLGYRRHRAYLVARTFVRHDEQFVREVAATRHTAADFFSMIRNRRAEVERTLRNDLERGGDGVDASWDIEALRSEVLEGQWGAPGSPEDRRGRNPEAAPSGGDPTEG